jgi:hypothetical protein
LELIKTFGKNPNSSLRLYQLRLISDSKANSFAGIRNTIEQLTHVRNRFQDCRLYRNCIRRWSCVSLLGAKPSELRASLDILCTADKESFSKFEALSKQFQNTHCSLLYCVRGTKANFQQRIGSFLQYPPWYITTPFPELENYLQTEFFKTRMSHLT